jgi:hypothetical protein
MDPSDTPSRRSAERSFRPLAAPAQRLALGVLFVLLTAVFAGVAVAAGTAGQWVIAAAGAALAFWMAGLALKGLRR